MLLLMLYIFSVHHNYSSCENDVNTYDGSHCTIFTYRYI